MRRDGPVACVSLPDGQEVLVVVRARSRAVDGRFWYRVEVPLYTRVAVPGGAPRPEVEPITFDVPHPLIQPIPGEDYGQLNGLPLRLARLWAVEVRPRSGGPVTRVHADDCPAAGPTLPRVGTAQAREALARPNARGCEQCRPAAALRRDLG